MSNNRGGRRPYRQNKSHGNEEHVKELDENNPILASFKEYAKELDDKHDRYERVVKLGRDITIESKRIIFLLHTIDPRKDNREKVLTEAEKRLQSIFDTNFAQIARELCDLDQNQYARAFSPGLQEFIEAYTFYEYLSNSPRLSDWNDLQAKLKYAAAKSPEAQENEEPIKTGDVENKETYCMIKPIEFMLGLADLGGEIMRRCINSLGSNDTETCFQTCRTLQSLYSGYLRIGVTGNRDMPRKIVTLRQSTLKAENVCYNIKVRGNEAAKWNAIDGFSGEKANFDDDEGFF